jgi:hypothetical protein
LWGQWTNFHHKDQQSERAGEDYDKWAERKFISKRQKESNSCTNKQSAKWHSKTCTTLWYWTETYMSGRCRVREGGRDKSNERDVRQVAAGNNVTRRKQ